MTRGVRWYLVSSLVLVALVAVAGCSHYMLAEREPWRHEAELTCLNSGAVNDTAGRVRIAAIEGPGACGIDYPLRVSALGESGPLSYDDEPVPPGSIPNSSVPRYARCRRIGRARRRPFNRIRCRRCKPARRNLIRRRKAIRRRKFTRRRNPIRRRSRPHRSAARCRSSRRERRDDDDGIPGGPPHPYYGEPNAPSYSPSNSPSYSPSPYQQRLPSQAEQPPAGEPVPPLGPPAPATAVSSVPVQVQPPATLACPVMSALDQWIASAVQPAAAHWFRQPVVEIKQISAYSCRGMNGNPNAHISEHAFGNALDVAEFDLADGHKISVQYGWHGTPEEQGFLHDVQAAACEQFTTVLAPGANVYHYNHIHVDLMRHYNGRHICEPSAIPGEVAAARARSQFAERHYGDPRVTGSIKASAHEHEHSSGEDDDSLPEAVPGDD